MITVMERHGNETKATHEEKHKTGVQQIKHEEQQLLNNQASLPVPPSSTSSPSHEFSFTISLHPSNNNYDNNKTKSPAPPSPPLPFSATTDLSPADEIFFHGHLLPLHLLSVHPNVSASPSRSSTNSLNSCTFTLKDELLHDHNENDIIFINNKNNDNNTDKYGEDDLGRQESKHVREEGKTRTKSRSFSSLFPKWRKHHQSSDHDHQETDEYDDGQDHRQKLRKSKLDIVKRYMRLVKPFISFRHKRSARNAREFLRQPAAVSFGSGSLRVRKKKELLMGGRGNEYLSAPVSIRTSPTNSGLLVASGNITPTNKYNSTMEELHAAIQGAIAHCKKSVTQEGEKEHADKTI
ncbi:hypothetical protein OROGR_032963 [Orobanche gracilis]